MPDQEPVTSSAERKPTHTIVIGGVKGTRCMERDRVPEVGETINVPMPDRPARVRSVVHVPESEGDREYWRVELDFYGSGGKAA